MWYTQPNGDVITVTSYGDEFFSCSEDESGNVIAYDKDTDSYKVEVTSSPSSTPTVAPTVTPTIEPTATPSVESTPTIQPTTEPTGLPLPTVKEYEMDGIRHLEVTAAEAHQSGYAYAAVYDSGNRVIEVHRVKFDVEKMSDIQINDIDNANGVRIFIWTENMKPITSVWEKEKQVEKCLNINVGFL